MSIANDPVCNVIVPRKDEISINEISSYGDRWFLGFMDVYDLKISVDDKIGQVMFECGMDQVFILRPFRRLLGDSFTATPDFSKYSSRLCDNIPEEINLLNISNQVSELMHIEIGGIVVRAYNSPQGYAKAKAEYFIRNRDFLGIDPDIDADAFFTTMVHPPKIKPECEEDPNSYPFYTKGKADGDPLKTIIELSEDPENWETE